MALPLPKVVADTGPGGGLVTAMGGMNALSNAMLDTQINKVKAQYAPMTTQAEAASKLAYANLMGPQFLAKLMGNDSALANMSEDQKSQALSMLYRAGSGQGTGNALMGGGQGMPQPQGGGNPMAMPSPQQNPSLSGWLSDKMKNIFSGGQQTGSGSAPQQSQNPFAINFSGPGVHPELNRVMAGVANVESGGAQNPYSLIGKDTGNGDHAIGKYQVLASNVPSWTKEAFGQSMTPDQFRNSPEAQEKLAGYMMNKHLNAGNSPNDVGSIWFTGKPLSQAGNVRDSYGTTPNQYVNKMNQGMNQFDQTRPNTYAENTGAYKGIVKEGEESGTIRAKDIDELNTTVFNAQTHQATLDDISGILASPEFEKIRQVPLLGHHELAYYAKEGTPEQQNMVGRYFTDTGNVIKDSARDFAGQFRKGEQQLLNGMKPNAGDTVDTARGKVESLSYFNKMLSERSRLTSKIMSQYHVNKLQAQEEADKQINGEQIRQGIHDKLNPTVTIRNRKTGETKTISASEARALGVPNV